MRERRGFPGDFDEIILILGEKKEEAARALCKRVCGAGGGWGCRGGCKTLRELEFDVRGPEQKLQVFFFFFFVFV